MKTRLTALSRKTIAGKRSTSSPHICKKVSLPPIFPLLSTPTTTATIATVSVRRLHFSDNPDFYMSESASLLDTLQTAQAGDLLRWRAVNRTFYMTSQGRFESYRNALPSYFMLHAVWRFNKQPKNKG